MEDNESCTTEIYLNDDGSVDVSMTETDGPLPKATFGTWKVLEEGGEDDDSPPPFEMLIGRTFGTGIGMGEDAGSFTVERTFRGYVTMVGDAVAISGSMHILVSFVLFYLSIGGVFVGLLFCLSTFLCTFSLLMMNE